MNRRATLTKKEQTKFDSLLKGYEGECNYDRIFTQTGHDNLYIFRNLYLQTGQSCTQYDTLIINGHGIINNEIKNYSGNYSVENGNWFNKQYQVNNDSFSQLNRSIGKLMNLRDSGQSDFKISGKLVFPNDSFTLRTDDSSNWNKIILRSGMREYFLQLNRSSQHLGNKSEFISQLISDSMIDNPYFKPIVDKNRLKHGLHCGSCGSFNLSKSRFHLVCNKCNTKESNETHLLRAISDYKFLFYNETMSSNDLMSFIDKDLSYDVVRKVLLEHCYKNKNGNHSTYILKHFDFDSARQYRAVNTRYKDYVIKVVV